MDKEAAVHEQDFRQALRDTMAVVTTPSMNENVVLDAARRATRRRRAMWASAASGLAVVALATGVALAAPGGDRSGPRVGAEVTSTTPPEDTEPDWPDGQTDATASSGPRYEQGVHLLDELLEAVPPGYDSPEYLAGQLPGARPRSHEAVWSDDGSWDYTASIPLVRAGGFGSLSASVRTAVDPTDETPCALSLSVLNPVPVQPGETDPNTDESCTEVTVAGKQVGVAAGPGTMLVRHRHPDGTMVMVAQRALAPHYGQPGLTELPLTAEQLAELAAGPRLHLD